MGTLWLYVYLCFCCLNTFYIFVSVALISFISLNCYALFHNVSKIHTNLSLICIPNNNEQCCQLPLLVQETPDFGLYLLDIRQSLPFLRKNQLSNNEISNILHCLSNCPVNIEHFLIHSDMPLSCHINSNVIGGKKIIRSNVTMPTTSFLRVLCHHKYLGRSESKSIFCTNDIMYHCVMMSSMIPSLSIGH